VPADLSSSVQLSLVPGHMLKCFLTVSRLGIFIRFLNRRMILHHIAETPVNDAGDGSALGQPDLPYEGNVVHRDHLGLPPCSPSPSPPHPVVVNEQSSPLRGDVL